ncbi:MAG TPA: hypothetical protein VF503_33460 [Sphingobium sp.]|uniref:hypothetical protein n=1 Tax=Sphingobium sp. TaxID=1912891 RepID=UPI002ED59383
MNRSERNVHTRSKGRNERARLIDRLPAWAIFARHRRPGARLRMFHWPFPPARSTIDNSIPERLERDISRLSRAMGPILLVVALGGTVWGIAHWLG